MSVSEQKNGDKMSEKGLNRSRGMETPEPGTLVLGKRKNGVRHKARTSERLVPDVPGKSET